jgi:hypothetical protein
MHFIARHECHDTGSTPTVFVRLMTARKERIYVFLSIFLQHLIDCTLQLTISLKSLDFYKLSF